MFIPLMTPVQWFSMGMSAVLIVLCTWVMEIKHEKRNEYLPWMLWFIHTLIYYSALSIMWQPMAGNYGDWGSVLRLHGYLTIGYHLGYKLVQHYVIR